MNPVILTANDPEPPIGSVMLGEGGAWQRASDGWYATGLIDSQEWYELFEYESTLTLVYRGPDPEPPITWKFSDPEPPEGTVIAMNLGTPRTFTSTGWKGIYDSYRSDDPYTYRVLRWGWTK